MVRGLAFEENTSLSSFVGDEESNVEDGLELFMTTSLLTLKVLNV